MGRRVIQKSPVEVVEVDGARMVTLRAGDATSSDRIRGAYVRLQPYAGMSTDEVEAIKAEIIRLGALAVKSLPIPRTEDAVAEAPGGIGSELEEDNRPLREVVHERAARARNIEDPKALKLALDEAMDDAGL